MPRSTSMYDTAHYQCRSVTGNVRPPGNTVLRWKSNDAPRMLRLSATAKIRWTCKNYEPVFSSFLASTEYEGMTRFRVIFGFFLLEDIDSIFCSLHLWIESCYNTVRRKNISKFFTCYINFLRWNFTIKFLSLKARTKVGKHSEPISYRSGWFQQRIVKFQINSRRGIWAINLFYTLYYYYRKIFPIEFSSRLRFVCPCLRTFLEIFYFDVVDKSGTTIYV